MNMWFTSSFMGKQFLSLSDLWFGFIIENRNLDEVWAGRAGGFTLEVKISDPSEQCWAELRAWDGRT
jgi:hypothetical protein